MGRIIAFRGLVCSDGKGLTVVCADQCPYFRDAVQQTLETAEEVGVQSRQAVEVKSAREIQDLAPCPQGVIILQW